VTRYVAFLRGVNLGKRTVRSADLKQAFVGMGFADARTLIASGNVVFSASETDEDKLVKTIEAGLEKAFGFDIGTVLRSHAELEAMVISQPFAKIPEGADAKLYVGLLRERVGGKIELPIGSPGDFDVLSVTERDIFAIAWHMPNGRYGEGLAGLEKHLPKGTLVTMRNWNTILKAAT
jgi:uncharacterized protein (DUF1697 family)